VLGAIYEPRFLRASHGFRLDHLCYTAFRQIKQKWRGTPWIKQKAKSKKGCRTHPHKAALKQKKIGTETEVPHRKRKAPKAQISFFIAF
jgi:retron-type reverse transcriptase